MIDSFYLSIERFSETDETLTIMMRRSNNQWRLADKSKGWTTIQNLILDRLPIELTTYIKKLAITRFQLMSDALFLTFFDQKKSQFTHWWNERDFSALKNSLLKEIEFDDE